MRGADTTVFPATCGLGCRILNVHCENWQLAASRGARKEKKSISERATFKARNL